MKPVVILRFYPIEGPGYFAIFLDNHHIPWQMICLDQGDQLPVSLERYGGLVLMGGPMSVHDQLPWISPVLMLIRQAVAASIPVLGHCLGGQLLSTALGGDVINNPVKELGWGWVNVADNSVAQTWFDDITAFESFHWHGETFSLPAGTTRLLSSPFCLNQAFSLDIHLGLQCHVEMTEEMVKTWCQLNAAELAQHQDSPAVQGGDEIQNNLPQRLAALQSVADRLYQRWILALKD
ncbi:type 1 glutamine amidotransferase [Nitrosomonas halophila]|uniref:GMP synthase-Glutamine amidotransferase n=1 Tax=Nitrosomonas halophila TaxID=44576 RepID=A0A1H3KBF7_9PROT|nr:type 1 glutamine amidotransferase [Nitrosomonas halophila]SDY49239.1 GMP synthase-Glutamine amidotransferase [Nitrosomonas halophila]